MSLRAKPERPPRLFLALWPGAEERQRLGQLAQQVTRQYRRQPDDQLHLTLVFLGNTDAQRQHAYEAALAEVPIPAMELVLDRYGYWPQSRLLWLGCNQTPPELTHLVDTLHERLRGCGFVPEPQPFQAHVTLARRFRGPVPVEAPAVPLRWSVNEIALIESVRPRQEARYRVLRRWPQPLSRSAPAVTGLAR